MGKKILVTGGAGFVGANLVELLSDSDKDVTVFDNLSRGGKSNLPSNFSGQIFEKDLRDNEFLQEAVADQDVVIHLAAFGSVVESVASPVANFEINASGTLRLLEACRAQGVKKVVFASTGGALMGNAIPPVNESTVPRPISPYGASKLAGEGYCSAYAAAYDMDITALRFANVVGPRSLHKKGVVNTFFRRLHQNEDLVVYGDGSSTRDYLDVRDLCRGIRLAAESEISGFNVFHLASGVETSIDQLAHLCQEIVGVSKAEIRLEPTRAGEVERNFADYSEAKARLGWVPEVKLLESLETTWHWMKPRLSD